MKEAPEPVRGNVSMLGSASVSPSALVKIRSRLAHRQLTSARLFARESGRIETRYLKIRSESGKERESQEYWGRHSEEHWAYVVGAVLTSVAFLEALINELFLDAVDHESHEPKPEAPDPSNPIYPLSAQSRELMARMWPLVEKRGVSIVEKFDAALDLAGKERFDPGVSPSLAAVKVLIELRNNLVHYKPEWSSGDPSEFSNLEKRLQNQRVAINPVYAGTGNSFFPDKCLSHGCAEWAVTASKTFADEFCSRMGITPIYRRVLET